MNDLQEIDWQGLDIKNNLSLAPYTRLKVGGCARYFFEANSLEELQDVLRIKPPYLPLFVLGAGSNLIVRDGGYSGLVLKLGVGFSYLKRISEFLIEVGAGAKSPVVAQNALEMNLTGLEFFAGIPGTVGGALTMNAGANGSDLSKVMISCKAVDCSGNIHEYSNLQMKFRYRGNGLANAKEMIFISCILQGELAPYEEVANRMKEFRNWRLQTQPFLANTFGSTFKNPEGYSSWKLIDDAGLRGYQHGGARVSQKHSNFLVNEEPEQSTAKDFEELIAIIQQKVHQRTGIKLEKEVVIIGDEKN